MSHGYTCYIRLDRAVLLHLTSRLSRSLSVDLAYAFYYQLKKVQSPSALLISLDVPPCRPSLSLFTFLTASS